MDKSVPAGAAVLLKFIYRTEVSKSPPDCYEVIYANKQHKLAKPLTEMTLDEVIAAQRGWSKNHGSSAAGAAQFMRNTLLGLMKELGLRGSQKLDGNLQDRLAFHLLKRRGFDGFMAGTISRTEFGKRLAQEWASFPVLANCQGAHRKLKRGQSFYAGDGLNKSLTAPETVEAVLDRVKELGSAVPVPEPAIIEKPVVVEKPVVADPGELETPPSKSKTVWSWLYTIIAAPFLAFGNLDWRVQIVLVVVIVAAGIYAIKRRNDLFKAVKSLKAEIG